MIHKLFEGFEGKLTSSQWAKIVKMFAGYVPQGYS